MSEEPESSLVSPGVEQPTFLTKTKFEDFDLAEEILSSLRDSGFIYCTRIQAQVLPVSLAGKDVAGQAQTGTGKTAAFLVTTFARLLADPPKGKTGPSALIIAPTRELALQVYEDAETLGRHTGLRLALAIGGIDYGKQADIISQGTDIVICTPGRIIDYMKQKIFKPNDIKVLVIDEADRLLDLGFVKDLRYLLRRLPSYDKRQSMLFSATLSYRVLELTYEYMNLPEFISVAEEVAVERIDQFLIHTGAEEKLSLLLGLFEREDWTRALIFVNTKSGVEWLAHKLRGNGLPAEGITGDLPQPKRLRLMARFKEDKIKILVATDVASRGIHVEDISHVFNYDLPQDAENYVHRIGRTARAGKGGKAFSLACEQYVYHLEPLEELLGYQIPILWPEEDWFKADAIAGQGPARRARPTRPPRGAPPPPRGSKRPRSKSAAPKPRKRKIARPGGIFGLAPGGFDDNGAASTEAPPPETEPKPKKKRRRRRKKPVGAANGEASVETGSSQE